jgi:hypothetical protein
MEVLSCYNPLKQVRYRSVYKAQNVQSNYEEIENKWKVNLVPQYMDLTKGIWNVSLDSYIYKISSPQTVTFDTILEISTSLCTSYQSIAGKSLNKTVFTRLGNIHVYSKANLANFGPFEKKWFMVDNVNNHFDLHVTAHELSFMRLPKIEIEFDISFLFQRIK